MSFLFSNTADRLLPVVHTSEFRFQVQGKDKCLECLCLSLHSLEIHNMVISSSTATQNLCSQLHFYILKLV